MLTGLITNTQLFLSQDVNQCATVVWITYYCVFIRCLDSHSDGTHSLHWIHCWSSKYNAKFIKICSDEETNILEDLRVKTFSANINFWVNYSFNSLFLKQSLFQITLMQQNLFQINMQMAWKWVRKYIDKILIF